MSCTGDSYSSTRVRRRALCVVCGAEAESNEVFCHEHCVTLWPNQLRQVFKQILDRLDQIEEVIHMECFVEDCYEPASPGQFFCQEHLGYQMPTNKLLVALAARVHALTARVNTLTGRVDALCGTAEVRETDPEVKVDELPSAPGEASETEEV